MSEGETPAAAAVAPAGEIEFSSGLLNCMDNPGTCIMGTLGDVYSHTGNNWCLGCCCGGYIMPCIRKELRQKYNIKGTLTDGFADDCLSCIIPVYNCLNVCQMANEVANRKKGAGAPPVDMEMVR